MVPPIVKTRGNPSFSAAALQSLGLVIAFPGPQFLDSATSSKFSEKIALTFPREVVGNLLVSLEESGCVVG